MEIVRVILRALTPRSALGNWMIAGVFIMFAAYFGYLSHFRNGLVLIAFLPAILPYVCRAVSKRYRAWTNYPKHQQ